MSTTVFNIILNFMKDEPVKHITAGSVIYKGTEDDQTITKEDLFKLFKLMIDAIQTMKNIAGGDFEHFKKISNIHLESEQVPLDDNMIKKNIRYLQGKLSSDSSSLSLELYQNVNKIPITNLTWKDPLASRVVNKCHEFVSGFSKEYTKDLFVKLTHDGEWKEMDKTLMDVTGGILDVLADVWVNLPFGSELMKMQSEGMYVTDIIIPSIQASLKGLTYRQFAFISIAERQSIPMRGGKNKEDKIKLWRETNDGMFWVQPEKGQFGIVGIQQLTPVSIESFKKELDLKLVTIIAELEKGNDCLNDILDALIVIPVAIIDVKEALMDIIKASIDNNARFKELENDDREYDESYQENKERLLEYEERL
ncbi:11318_t:CDS:2 [Entrophospora sp. SA101]|nr:11318_t:CDS:2 [Entrophospora sp. SA101]